MKILILLTSLVLAVQGARYLQAQDKTVERQYIVILERGVDLEETIGGFLDDVSANGIGATILHRYSTVVNGFVTKVTSASRGLHLLMLLPGVDFVEQDKVIEMNEAVGSWGIDRIDQRDLPLDIDMTLDDYGRDVHIYVIDTGINPDHEDFGGRATTVKDFVDPVNGTGIDCQGHGTHCAGTAASNTYGIARQANVYGIRILDCSGSGFISASVAAMDWIATEGQRPAVASMSYGGGFSQAEFQAAMEARQRGVVLVAAAGNSNSEACDQSPAGSPDVITVGSTTIDDERSYFSNYGRCVQLFAPGSTITSLTHDSNTGISIKSGTSMACPHVAGIAAVLLGRGYSPEQTYQKIVSSATFGKVANANGTPNLLAYLS